MRSVLQISLPQEMAIQVTREAKRQKYDSISEFMRFVVRGFLEAQELKELRKSQAEFRRGKSVRLKSIRDIM